ncbi:hypothetical protein C2E23DRAFT_906542 [Lenzites betulinus]|nr:hypothetical protein C2E23DRAFT_906542 [Lenzites betulinus]
MPPAPLYVVPRVSSTHPMPTGSTTLLFTAVFPSAHPLTWGRTVQLYLVNPVVHAPSTFLLPPNDNYPAVPLAFRGTIVGERTRFNGWVEVVVVNENRLERARRAFICVSVASVAMPDLAELVAERLLLASDEPLDGLEGSPTPRAVPPVLRDAPTYWPESGAPDARPVAARDAAPASITPRGPCPLFPQDPVWAYRRQAPSDDTAPTVATVPGADAGHDRPADPTSEPPVFYTTASTPRPSSTTGSNPPAADGEAVAGTSYASVLAAPQRNAPGPTPVGMSTGRARRALTGRRHSGYRRLRD